MKISVIIPSYNSEKTLDRAVSSVLKQNVDDLEIVIVDDGSNDRSVEMCDNYAKNDRRFKIVHLEHNKGLPNARNVALDCVSDNGYLFFLDSDDELLPNAFSNLLNVAKEHPDVDIVCGGFVNNNITTGEIQELVTCDEYCGLYTYNLLRDTFIVSWFDFKPTKIQKCLTSCLYRTAFLKENKIKFHVEQLFGEDARFMIESYCFAKSIFVVNYPVYIYYYDEVAVSAKYFEKYRESTIEFYKYNLQIIKKMKLGPDAYSNLIGRVYCGINSYVLCASNRNVSKKTIYSFIYHQNIFKTLITLVFMTKKQLFYANVSRKDKLVALLYLTGFYKKALNHLK